MRSRTREQTGRSLHQRLCQLHSQEYGSRPLIAGVHAALRSLITHVQTRLTALRYTTCTYQVYIYTHGFFYMKNCQCHCIALMHGHSMEAYIMAFGGFSLAQVHYGTSVQRRL
jgi:hypothetical protein